MAAMDFSFPLQRGFAIKEPFPLQPPSACHFVPVRAFSRLAEVGLMPQAGEFLALLTVGFLAADLVFPRNLAFLTSARPVLNACLAFHYVLNLALVGIGVPALLSPVRWGPLQM